MSKQLTDRACSSTKPDPTKDKVLCAGNCLRLRIRPSGTRTWEVDFTSNGVRKKVTLGAFSSSGSSSEGINGLLESGILSLAQARMIAEQWKLIRRAGRNPVQEWEERKQIALDEGIRENAEPTLNYVIDQFERGHVEGKASAPAVRYRLKLIRDGLGESKIKQIKRPSIVTLIENVAVGRREGSSAKQLAGEVLTLIKRVWRFAESREWVTEGYMERLTRADFDARPNRREVTLRIDEMMHIWQVLADIENCKSEPETLAALKLMMLTGQRECEVTGAEWSEINIKRREWHIPATRTKNHRAHLVHLSPQSIAVLEDIRKLTSHSMFVFASPRKDKQPIWGRSVNNALGTLFRRKVLHGITQCCVHDFRRTLISRLPDLGFDSFIGHKIANHKLPGILAHYNHAEYLKERKEALEIWGSAITAKPNDPE